VLKKLLNKLFTKFIIYTTFIFKWTRRTSTKH